MLLVGMIALTVRLGAYSIMEPGKACAWRVFLIELLNGVSFSFTHLAGVKEAALCAPPGWEATFQAIYTAAHVQLPAIFISFLGGYVWKWWGGRVLLQITFGVEVVALGVYLMHIAFTVAMEKLRRRPCRCETVSDRVCCRAIQEATHSPD